MNRILLATTALAIAAVAGQHPAAAQMAVYDGANNAQTASNFIQQIGQMRQEWTTLQSQLGTMNSLLAATQHGNSTLSIGQGLSNLSSQMPGASSGYIPGMAFGSGITSQGQQFYNQNHVYTPQGTDFAAQEMQRRQAATANMQGEVLTGLQASDQRITELGELQSDIENNDDPTYLAATAAHIQSEQTFLANEQTKIQRLQLMQGAQAQVDQQRAEQNARKEAEDLHTAAAAAAGW